MDRYFRQCVVSIWVGVEIVRCFLDKMVGKIAQRSVSRRQLGTVEGTVFIKYIYCLGSLSSCNRLYRHRGAKQPSLSFLWSQILLVRKQDRV